MIYTRRAYEARVGETAQGKTFLVDRLWPRGIKKSELKVDGWLKGAAPSTELRQWLHREPEKWMEFRKRYYRELDRVPEALEPVLEAARNGDVYLLYSSMDTEHNNAEALRAYLEEKLEN